MLKICSFFVLFVSSALSGISKPVPHPLLKAEAYCLDKSTRDSAQCLRQVYKVWDKELNNVYKKIINFMDKELFDKNIKAKEAFKESQKQWIVQRDKEFTFYKGYYNRPGTIWGLVEQRACIEFVKRRVQMLYHILESTDMSGDFSKNYYFDHKK